MDIEWLRKVCLSLPHTTEQVQWGNDLLFKVHGKMFAVTPLEPAPVCLSFKCSDEERDAINREELAALIRNSYELVMARLPKRLRQSAAPSTPRKSGKPKKRANRRKARNRKTR